MRISSADICRQKLLMETIKKSSMKLMWSNGMKMTEGGRSALAGVGSPQSVLMEAMTSPSICGVA